MIIAATVTIETPNLPRPEVAFWGAIIRQYGEITPLQRTVVEGLARFPGLTDAEVARRCKVNRSGVYETRQQPWFRDVYCRYLTHYWPMFCADVRAVWRVVIRGLAKRSIEGSLTANETTLLIAATKAAGIMSEGATVALSFDGEAKVLVVQDRVLAALKEAGATALDGGGGNPSLQLQEVSSE